MAGPLGHSIDVDEINEMYEMCDPMKSLLYK